MDASVPTTNHRVILRQKDNGTLLGIEFKKKYRVAGLPQLNIFCLIV